MKYFTRAPGGEEFGPFSSVQLRELVRNKRLGPGDHVRRDTGSSWSRFEDIPAFAEAFDSIQGDADSSPSHSQAAELEPEEPRPSPAAALEANPFVARGVLVESLPGEKLLFVLEQSFLDALRNSFLAAITGKRGVMICTSRRVVVSQPTFTSSATRIAFLERVGVVGRTSRMSLVLLIGGVLFTLLGGFGVFGALVAPTNALDGSAIFLAMNGVFLFIGLTMLLFSRQRVLEVHADSPVLFVCAAAGDWHLGQLDAARMACGGGGTDQTVR